MTITMAKRARAPAALLALLLAPTAFAEVKFTPSILGSETFSDNVNQRPADQAESSFITEVTPSLSLVSNGPRLRLSAEYQLHLYSYSNKVDNTNNASSQYQLNMQAKLIDQLLDLDASATRQSTSRSAFGPQGTNSLYSDSNRTDVSTYTIAPTLRHRFGGTADAYVRYSRNQVKGDTLLGTTNGDNISANISSGSNFTTVGWGLNAIQDSFSGGMFGDSTSQNIEASLRYRLSQSLSLTGTGGYDKYDYATLGGNDTKGASYTGGFIWAPSPRTRLQMSYGKRYYGNTGSLDFTFRSHRSAMTATYSDVVTTSRQQFLASSVLNTAALLDSLLTASIPDPVERQKAVAAYMANSNLGAGLTNNTNYVSNVFQRQKRFQLGYSLLGQSNTSTVSVYKTRSAALSSQTADSDLLGQNLAILNNNLDSIGATASYSHRLTRVTQALASLDVQRSKTLDSDLTTNNESIRLGLTHSFDSRLRGTAEVRQTRGSYFNAGNSRYRENAISATISQQF
jgi:uncharacterized protein (PEP-CTERM system associated)